MFAILGDIEFELITYWEGFESQFGVDYAEHARIEGKPGLQFVGEKLDDIQLSLVFHQHYCVPDVELARLKSAMSAHQALALVFGNGDYRGWFVITDIRATSEQTDSTGNVLALNATVSLREYVGDPKKPLTPPAVTGTVLHTGTVSAAAPKASGIAKSLRDGIKAAKQANAALQTSMQAVRVAQKMQDNPHVALGRIPGLFVSMGQISSSLGKSTPAFGAISNVLPEAAQLARASSQANGLVQQSQTLLTQADPNNLVSILGAVSWQLGTVSQTFTQMSPALSALTASIATRRA